MKAQTTRHDAIRSSLTHTFAAATLALALLVSGCGGGGGGGTPAVNGVATSTQAANSFSVTSDSYGLTQANYLVASSSTLGVVLRSAIATSVTDPNFKTVLRVDVPLGFVPAGTYSLGGPAPGTPAFPGAVYVFNGHQSTLLGTVGGTITFGSFGTKEGERITGSFSTVIEDGGDNATPKARYTVAASFDLGAGSSGPLLPAPSSSTLAKASYDANCASCHALGSYDTTAAGAPDVALKGGKLDALFTPGQAGHQGVRLASDQIGALKVLLNAN